MGGRMVAAALAAALLGLVAGAAGGFLGVSAIRGSGGPVDCGAVKCLPVDVAAFVASQKARGFTCDATHCELQAGTTRYEETFSPNAGRVQSLLASVASGGGGEVTDHGRAFLHWIATLPFPQEQEASAAAKGWVDRQLGGRAEKRALIDAFEYEVRDAGPGMVRIEIRPGSL